MPAGAGVRFSVKQVRSSRNACLTARTACDFFHGARRKQIPMPTPQAGQTAAPAATRAGVSHLILFATVFFDLLGFGIVIPFLPMYAARLGIGATAIGVILSAYSAMQFICAPLLGRLSDRIGRRPIIMLGLFGSSLSYLIYAVADSFPGLLISRAVHGACAATISTAQAYVADTTEESKRAHAMGMIGAAFGLGFVLGPAAGGALGGASLRRPVIIAAALTFANLIFAALWLPESTRPVENIQGRRDDEIGAAPRRPWLFDLYRSLGRHRAIARLFLIAFLLTFAIASLEATFSLTVPAVYGYAAAGVGGLLAFAGLVQAIAQGYLIGKLAPRIGESALMLSGAAALALGLAPLGSWPSRGALYGMLALIASGYGFGSTSAAALISRRTARDLQGEALGINQSVLSLARILGPIAGGLAYAIGPAAPYLVGAVIAAAAMVLAMGISHSRAARGG
jgi:MFS transporter, DHA1 family, tetracycline resistance protein